MIHRNKRPAPSYHWEGFGRKNTKPPWFDVRIFDKERRDMGWVINNTDPPGGSTKVCYLFAEHELWCITPLRLYHVCIHTVRQQQSYDYPLLKT